MRTRKALSTVIGAVFAIIALTTTVTYISYSMGILDNYNQSVLTKNQQLSDINNEKFKISSVTVPNNNKLNITVANNGNLPIKFTKIWVQDITTADSVRSYTPTNNFVSPSGTLVNLGQSIPFSVDPAKSYNIKLVTSRGNTQQLAVNSASFTKLLLQLYAFPSTVPSGFTSQVVLVVTNNSTSTLVNVAPTASVSPNDPTKCVLGTVSPLKYDTLQPGGTIVFVWPLTNKGNANDVCTATAGFTGQTMQTTVTATQITLSSTTYAQNAGVITVDYTSFRWAQAGGTLWHNDWQFPASTNTAFQVTFANNNQTAGGYSLFLSQNSQLIMTPTGGNSGGAVHQPYVFYIVKSITANPYGMTAYSPDFASSIANQGGIATLYFGSATVGGNSNSCGGSCTNNLSSGQYYGMLILYGKFSTGSGVSGGTYAQTIPFFAVITS